MQLQTSEGKTGAVVVSTVKEAWEVWNAGLVKEGVVNDVRIPDIPSVIGSLIGY